MEPTAKAARPSYQSITVEHANELVELVPIVASIQIHESGALIYDEMDSSTPFPPQPDKTVILAPGTWKTVHVRPA